MMKKAVVLLPLLVLVLASCYSPVHVYFYEHARSYPATDPAYVELLRNEPREAHIRFAEVRVRPQSGMTRREVDEMIRHEGAAIGAHALVIIVDNIYRERVVYGPYWASRKVYREPVIVGIAIRFTR
jgi:hypothetical protein